MCFLFQDPHGTLQTTVSSLLVRILRTAQVFCRLSSELSWCDLFFILRLGLWFREQDHRGAVPFPGLASGAPATNKPTTLKTGEGTPPRGCQPPQAYHFCSVLDGSKLITPQFRQGREAAGMGVGIQMIWNACRNLYFQPFTPYCLSHLNPYHSGIQFMFKNLKITILNSYLFKSPKIC